MEQSSIRNWISRIGWLHPFIQWSFDSLCDIGSRNAHPLREVGTQGTALTKHGDLALRELAKRNVTAVLSGHVHDAFDIMEDTSEGPVRMIGAGTLSQRTRSTPPSFNEIEWDGRKLTVCVRNLQQVDTRDMQIDDVPENRPPAAQRGRTRGPGAPGPAGRSPRPLSQAR